MAATDRIRHFIQLASCFAARCRAVSPRFLSQPTKSRIACIVPACPTQSHRLSAYPLDPRVQCVSIYQRIPRTPGPVCASLSAYPPDPRSGPNSDPMPQTRFLVVARARALLSRLPHHSHAELAFSTRPPYAPSLARKRARSKPLARKLPHYYTHYLQSFRLLSTTTRVSMLVK